MPPPGSRSRFLLALAALTAAAGLVGGSWAAPAASAAHSKPPGGQSGSSGHSKAPAISGFSPASGSAGTVVTIAGAHLRGASQVTFGGVAAAFSVASNSQITATVPAAAQTGRITVTTSGGTATSSTDFSVTPTASPNSMPPSISGFTPASGPVGTTVTISGGNFTGATAVDFNGTAASTFTVNGTGSQITATVPAGATTGPISVTVSGHTATSTASFGVTPGITGFTPGSGPPGTVVTITGTSFTGATAVDFNGTAAAGFTVDSDTQITATVPEGAATSSLIGVTTPSGTGTSSSPFDVTTQPPPTITGFTPSSGPPATQVTITGTDLFGASAVTFSGTPAAGFTVDSISQITATVPNTATYGPIGVTTPAGSTTSTDIFNPTTPAPAISTISPALGPTGTTVTITGSNFIAFTATGFPSATVVTFNGTPAGSYTVVSDTEITATVPPDATSGPITVGTVAGTTASSTSFTLGFTAGPFQVQFGSPTDPEEITSLVWNNSANLTGHWTNGSQCTGGYDGGDEEFFGNAWGVGASGVHPVLVGLGSTGGWTAQTTGGTTTVSISSAAAATAYCSQDNATPVTTSYQFPTSASDNTFTVTRTIDFGTNAFATDLRPYIPRLSPAEQYTEVAYPKTSGGLSTAYDYNCGNGCTETDWNGTWFAELDSNGNGMIVDHIATTLPTGTVQPDLWVDEDGGSDSNASSVVVAQPTGGFTGTVTEQESVCFFTGWTSPSANSTPPGC